MSQSIISTDLVVSGTLVPNRLIIPLGTVTDGSVVAATGIQASKLQQQYQPTYSQPSAVTSVTENKIVYVVQGATGLLVNFSVGLVVPNAGAATIAFDLLKNGTTVLSSPVTLTSSAVAYTLTAGALSVSTLTVGDILEIKVTATAGGGTVGKGAFARLTVREDAQ